MRVGVGMRKKKNLNIKKYSYFGAFLLFVFVCTAIGGVCFQYYNQLQATIRNESIGYLEEISKRISSNIGRIINDNYAVLNTIESVLINTNTSSFEDIKPIVKDQQRYWNYKDIMLVDENGIAYNIDGRTVALSGEAYLRKTVIDKQQSMSTSQLVNNEECIVFTIPLDNIKIGGKNMVALAASYDSNAFDEMLSMSSFEGKAYSLIINKDGTILVRPSAQYANNIGYNVISSIESSELDKESSIAELKENIDNECTGQIGFMLKDEHTYMVYTPVKPEEWYLVTFVPVNVINARSNLLLTITLVICGLITLVFAGLLALLMITYYRNRQKLERIAYVDDITGGHTIDRFYQLAQEALSDSNRPEYALVYTNIEKFKVLNEQFGRYTCDMILRCFYENISSNLSGKECMGRLTADNFCVLMEYEGEEAVLERFTLWFTKAQAYVEESKPIWSLPVVEFGIFAISNDTLLFPLMIDRAKLALKESSRAVHSKMHYAIYNDEVRRRLFRDKQLEDMMDNALIQKEFHVYLQPKYRVSDEKIGGAEALSRWISSTEGMIYPDEFIPLFEKNGFVIQLDLFVFEEVCSTLRLWMDRGLEPVKVSVNCSRIHLKNQGFINNYIRIADKYSIPYQLLEIELTEGVVMEDEQRLMQVIDEIHKAGFCCSMDDFGSGYSSLNLLQNITVDTLKLDKIFFYGSKKDSKRMQSVVSSIINMAQALNMETVAEGVEYPEQIKMLREMNCDYIQGYVFAKPMPINEFEQLTFGVACDREG